VAVLRGRNGRLRADVKEKRYMAKGKVKWFDDRKGFGFITPDDGSKDVFVHHSEVQGSGFKTLAENQAVEYEVTQGRKGLAATKVTKIGQ